MPQPQPKEQPQSQPKKPKRETPFIDPKDAAELLGVHVSTIYRLVLHGKIPARRLGGRRYLIRKEDMVRFAEGDPVVPVLRVEWRREAE